MREAYFAGGCFWCITPMFAELPGVDRVTSGYSGGAEPSPTYEQVKRQQTGHRETIRVRYDPALVSYERLLKVFLENVDPFDGGGQFIDRGHSYTLAVYYETEAEKASAEGALARLKAARGKEPSVALEPFSAFWEAEEYHQDWYRKNPEAFEKEMIESGRVCPMKGGNAHGL